MKKLILINITLLIWSTNLNAEMMYVGNDDLNVIDTDNLYLADILVGSSNTAGCAGSQCDFQQSFTTNYFSDDALRGTGIVTSNYTTSVKSPDNNAAFLDLAFSNNVVNGVGNDLILFFIGNTTTFSLEVFDKDENNLFTDSYTIGAPVSSDGTTISDHGDAVRITTTGKWELIDGYLLSAILIDLGESSEGTAIGNLHLNLENSNFSLAGGFHTPAAVVPLPMSIILFGSGLSLLGWIGRKKSM